MYIKTSATTKLQNLTKRIRGVCGGTSASKTISILLILIHYAQTHDNKTISIVSESLPHLKRGAMRDFLNIMQEHKYFRDDLWNKSDFIYLFETGSKIEFFSADQPYKVKGPRRDVLFVNEANHIPYETYTHLEVRTKEIIWLDWNPENEFWWYTDVVNKPDSEFVTLTYKDNEGLSPEIVKAIESRMGNKNWWQVYGLGQLGESEGRIFTGWNIIDEIPHEARLERYGLDFGFSNDPAAIVAVYKHNGGYILDEVLYRKGMLNSQLADVLKNEPYALIVADSAEPKSIEELRSYNLSIIEADKGSDSVRHGINYMQDQKISITKRSVNLIKEYRNYMWSTDKDGRLLNVPEPGWDHGLDGARYAITNLRGKFEDDFKLPDDTAWIAKI